MTAHAVPGVPVHGLRLVARREEHRGHSVAEQPTGTTPTLKQVIDRIVGSSLEGVQVAFPGTILSFDPATKLAKVRPTVQQKDKETGEFRPIPILGGVPVLFPSGSTYSIQYPLLPGDPVLVVFCSIAIEDWIQRGGPDVTPSSSRTHGLSDAVAIPGVRPLSQPLLPAPVNTLSMGGAAMSIVIDDTGLTVEIGGAVMKILVDDSSAKVTIGGATMEVDIDDTGRIDVGGANAAVVVDNVAGEVRIGDDLATSYIAKADLVLAAFNSLIAWANTHGHPAPFGTPPAVPLWPGGAPVVAATKGKVT